MPHDQSAILVLGAGGVGSYFGGRLAQGGADVTFLVRPARREQIERDGLRITSPLGDATLRAKTVLASELTPGYDFVILTCKTYDLDSSMDAIAPAVTGDCTIVPLLNGLAHLERLDERFGREHVLGGSCAIDVTLLKDGAIRHGGSLQRIVFGERDGRTSPRTQAFADALARPHCSGIIRTPSCCACGKTHDAGRPRGDDLPVPRQCRRGHVGARRKDAAEHALSANIEIATQAGYAPSEASVTAARSRLTDRPVNGARR